MTKLLREVESYHQFRRLVEDLVEVPPTCERSLVVRATGADALAMIAALVHAPPTRPPPSAAF